MTPALELVVCLLIIFGFAFHLLLPNNHACTGVHELHELIPDYAIRNLSSCSGRFRLGGGIGRAEHEAEKDLLHAFEKLHHLQCEIKLLPHCAAFRHRETTTLLYYRRVEVSFGCAFLLGFG